MEPSTLTCRKCNEAKDRSGFYTRKGEPDLSWCKACYQKWYAERNGGTVNRDCDWCGTSMTVTGRRAAEPKVFCSRPCKHKAKNDDERRARLLSKPDRYCVHCTKTLPKTMRADAKFCSAECNSAAHAVTRKIAKRAAYHNHPEPEYADGLVSRSAIAERDNYLCRLCGGRVAMWRAHPDPLAPSIDHKVPLSKGGGNTLDNLQLTHLRCNIAKGA